MESRIVALIQADTNLKSLVSDRVYPQAVPESGQKPAIVYTLVSDNREHEFDGPDEIVKARLQLTAWSNSYSASKSITREVIRLFDGYSSEYDGIRFHSIFLESAVDLYNHDLKEYGNNIDLIINYEEL